MNGAAGRRPEHRLGSHNGLRRAAPVLDGLKTTGTYVYAKNVSVPNKTAEVVVE
jgi:hypothetical protein